MFDIYLSFLETFDSGDVLQCGPVVNQFGSEIVTFEKQNLQEYMWSQSSVNIYSVGMRNTPSVLNDPFGKYSTDYRVSILYWLE